MPYSDIMGWNLGGVHLKAAHLDDRGKLRQVLQLPCPLWLGLDHLRQAVDGVMAAVLARIRYHAVTMTGELVDLFDSRVQGVQRLASVMEEKLAPADMGFYAGLLGAGVGRFLVEKLADRLQRQYLDFSSLLDIGYLEVGDPADCTPAVAVAKLARTRL